MSEPDLLPDCFHFSLGVLRMEVNLNCMYYSGHVFKASDGNINIHVEDNFGDTFDRGFGMCYK